MQDDRTVTALGAFKQGNASKDRAQIGRLGLAFLVENTHVSCRNHGGDGVLVNHLADGVLQQHEETLARSFDKTLSSRALRFKLALTPPAITRVLGRRSE